MRLVANLIQGCIRIVSSMPPSSRSIMENRRIYFTIIPFDGLLTSCNHLWFSLSVAPSVVTHGKMDVMTNTTGLPEPVGILQRLGLSTTTTVLLSVLTLFAFAILWPGDKNEPPSLKGAVPFLSTTYLFLAKKLEFSKRMR